jgi:hypothetical protein
MGLVGLASLPYLGLDVHHEDKSCVIYAYREVFPPAVGQRKEEYWDPEEPPVRWTEYHFPWPKTGQQAEAIADAMGWHDTLEPPDTPLGEFTAGVEKLLKPEEES